MAIGHHEDDDAEKDDDDSDDYDDDVDVMQVSPLGQEAVQLKVEDETESHAW